MAPINFVQNSYMRSVDNDELFQVLFKPKKILDGVDRQLKYDPEYCLHRCSYLLKDSSR